MTPEGKIKALVKKGLKTIIFCHGNWPVQNGMGSPMLDWHGVVGGRYVAIETKAPGKYPTALQENTIKSLREAGALVFVVSTPEQVATCIRRLKWINDYYAANRIAPVLVPVICP